MFSGLPSWIFYNAFIVLEQKEKKTRTWFNVVETVMPYKLHIKKGKHICKPQTSRRLRKMKKNVMFLRVFQPNPEVFAVLHL